MKNSVFIKAVISVCLCVFAIGICYALVMTKDKGTWSDTFPKEMEALREQSRTLDVATGIQETIFEIPFADREQFEKAWVHILKVKSEGAPLILLNSPSKMIDSTMEAGVRIRYPVVGGASETPDGKKAIIGPPWNDDIKTESGVLPEYVVNQDGKWIACDIKKIEEKRGFLYRARIDIELVVDGKIVDLNRIPIPPDTPIIDKRFEEKKENK
jgi:hypothetical protein